MCSDGKDLGSKRVYYQAKDHQAHRIHKVRTNAYNKTILQSIGSIERRQEVSDDNEKVGADVHDGHDLVDHILAQ